MITVGCDKVHSIVDFVLYGMSLAETGQLHLLFFFSNFIAAILNGFRFFFEIYTSMVYEEGIKLFSIHLIL